MTRSLILGAGGIGAALAETLKARGEVVTLSRRDGLDVTDPDATEAAMAALDGPFDRVVCALGILAPDGMAPEKSLQAIDAAQFAATFAVNATGPALLLRHAARLLPRERPSVWATLTARVGSIGDNSIGGWHAYRASKAAANMVVRGAAIELARTRPQAAIVALHPGTVATPFTADYAGRHKTVSAQEAAANLTAVMDGLTQDDTGTFRDYAGKAIPW
ncbi:MAG: SDR family oxidoreductase [Paracoccaceae bacterium]